MIPTIKISITLYRTISEEYQTWTSWQYDKILYEIGLRQIINWTDDPPSTTTIQTTLLNYKGWEKECLREIVYEGGLHTWSCIYS